MLILLAFGSGFPSTEEDRTKAAGLLIEFSVIHCCARMDQPYQDYVSCSKGPMYLSEW